MKEFLTAAQDATVTEGDETPPTPFTIIKEHKDGTPDERQECRAYKPGDGQVAVLMAMTHSHSATEEQIAGLINFFVSLLDESSHSYIVNRLLDRHDPFGVSHVQSIMEYLTEEWSGRPTKSSTGSTHSPPSSGEKSTPPTPALTS